MTTALQLSLVGGALMGLGVALLISRTLPAAPDLGDVLDRLSPRAHQPRKEALSGATQTTERLGLWALRAFPAQAWVATPTQALAILRISLARFYGEKVIFGLVGLMIAPLLTTLLAVLGLSIPLVVPVIGSLALGAVMFMLPDYNARDDAKKARAEFTRALGAYIDLVALERSGGSGTRQSMEFAAEVGDSWVFRRLGEELARSRWSGVSPWDALHGLAGELGLPELDDLADIMRLSGEEGAQVYQNLRARSAGLRSAMLNAELAKANEVGERMSIPMSLLGVIFLAILVAPALLRVMGGAG